MIIQMSLKLRELSQILTAVKMGLDVFIQLKRNSITFVIFSSISRCSSFPFFPNERMNKYGISCEFWCILGTEMQHFHSNSLNYDLFQCFWFPYAWQQWVCSSDFMHKWDLIFFVQKWKQNSFVQDGNYTHTFLLQ